MARRAVLLGLILLLPTGRAPAQDEAGDGCVYNRDVYPEGAELCQGGTLTRCEEGAWADIGLCDDPERPPPRSEGGDVEGEPDAR